MDDTDSTEGGCTTYVVRSLIEKLMDRYEIIGYPRLIRLNPNIPWKTRGNGALSLRIGKKSGKIKRKIGVINKKDVFSSIDTPIEIDKRDVHHIKHLVKETVEENIYVDDENTNPGFILLKKKPNFTWYQKGVTQILSLEEITAELTRLHAEFEGYKNQRGLIGATAATAWDPLYDHTYEFISYRYKDRWGTKRTVDPDSVKHMDTLCPHTFDNYDYKHAHNRIVPNSPCPILYGVRGDEVDELMSVPSLVQTETMESWLLFESNQGTDDHLLPRHIAAIQPYDSVITEGFVVDTPRTIHGGHVIFSIKDSTGSIDCAAYEPTKEFRAVIRGLSPGDIVEVNGGVREHPLTINLEKINIKHLVTQMKKIENPICPICGKHMKSKGTNQGFECRTCHTKNQGSILQEIPRVLRLGYYEVPVCARRHLSRPLKRTRMQGEQLLHVSKT